MVKGFRLNGHGPQPRLRPIALWAAIAVAISLAIIAPSPEETSSPSASIAELAEAAFACTCFSAEDSSGQRVMGRNFDWDRHPILALRTDPPGAFSSVSLVDLHYLGFSMHDSPFDSPEALAGAPRLPFDGINEKGLAAGVMAVDHAEGISPSLGPGATPRPLAGELVLIRLLLDKASSVEEAAAIARNCDVLFDEVPVHYFVADASGASAVIEYIGGRAQILRNEEPWQVSTNFIFAELPPSRREAACWRYAKAVRALASTGGKLGAEGVFGLLEEISQPSTTWSSAYELSSPRLTLCLGRDFSRSYVFAPRRESERE